MELSLDRINRLNPWWADARWDGHKDPHLAAAADAPFVWDPRPFTKADIDSGSVFTLRGPRQSGKTTLTKRLILEHVQAGFNRRACFLSLRTVETLDALREALDAVLRLWPDERGRWLFVLDELTFVKNWANVIADLHEHEPEFRRATVILTGSSAADLTDSADVLHGRRGPEKRRPDRLHTPMTFRDYVAARAPEAVRGDTLTLGELLSPGGRQLLTQGALHTAELTQYLEEYARCGGLPAPMTDMLRDRQVADETTLALWRGLAADIRRLDRNEARLEKLLSRMVVGLASLTNEADMARDMDVSKPTATSYLNLLAESFALLVLHQPDPKKQAGPSLTKPRKFYFGDPAFAAIPAVLSQARSTPKIPDLVENVLAIALFRQAERDGLQRFREPQRLFLWRSSDGREIDFITPVGDSTLAIESKFGRRMDGKDYESIQKAFGRGVMVSRETLITNRDILTVPAGVLLAHLG
jgi:predicted AAA+ superfamily ATPase